MSGHESVELKPKKLKAIKLQGRTKITTIKYAVVFEGDDPTGYSAYVLHLAGVIAARKILEETRNLMLRN